MTTPRELQTKLLQVYTQKGKGFSELSDDLALLRKQGYSRVEALLNLAFQNNIDIEEIRGLEEQGLSREEAKLRFLKGLERTKEFYDVLDNAHSESVFRRNATPSSLWYILPIALGLIGGLIAYVYVRDDDSEMAKDLFTVGLIVFIINVILFYLFLL